jgi:hypothetical protein
MRQALPPKPTRRFVARGGRIDLAERRVAASLVVERHDLVVRQSQRVRYDERGPRRRADLSQLLRGRAQTLVAHCARNADDGAAISRGVSRRAPAKRWWTRTSPTAICSPRCAERCLLANSRRAYPTAGRWAGSGQSACIAHLARGSCRSRGRGRAFPPPLGKRQCRSPQSRPALDNRSFHVTQFTGVMPSGTLQ